MSYDPHSVRLDEDTDAGEFVYQNLWNVGLTPQQQKAAEDVISSTECTPKELSVAVDDHASKLDQIVGCIQEYGMEFDSMRRRGELDSNEYTLADRGIESATRFVAAAATIARARSRGPSVGRFPDGSPNPYEFGS